MKIPLWAFPEHAKAIRDFKREIEMQKWLGSPEGQMLKVDNEFYKLEEQFNKQREEAEDPELYSYVDLMACQRSLAGELLLKTDNQIIKNFIRKRAEYDIPLSPVRPKPKTLLDLMIEKGLNNLEKGAENDLEANSRRKVSCI